VANIPSDGVRTLEPLSGLPPRPLVLIADSHDDSRTMLAILLGAAGYATAECDGGDGSVAHVRRLAPDVLLLSTASHGDSLGIVEAVRQDESTSRTRVVLITGHGDPDFRQRALIAGCEACLLKPVDIDQLVGELSRLTHGKPRARVTSAALRATSADARRLVEDCCTSIDSAKVALERARVVSARAAKQVERAKVFLERVAGQGPQRR
jgi:adenylate cyclase